MLFFGMSNRQSNNWLHHTHLCLSLHSSLSLSRGYLNQFWICMTRKKFTCRLAFQHLKKLKKINNHYHMKRTVPGFWEIVISIGLTKLLKLLFCIRTGLSTQLPFLVRRCSVPSKERWVVIIEDCIYWRFLVLGSSCGSQGCLSWWSRLFIGDYQRGLFQLVCREGVLTFCGCVDEKIGNGPIFAFLKKDRQILHTTQCHVRVKRVGAGWGFRKKVNSVFLTHFCVVNKRWNDDQTCPCAAHRGSRGVHQPSTRLSERQRTRFRFRRWNDRCHHHARGSHTQRARGHHVFWVHSPRSAWGQFSWRRRFRMNFFLSQKLKEFHLKSWFLIREYD